MKQFLKLASTPDGGFAATDDLAIGFILEAQRQGLQPGHDYQIIGFDRQQRAEELPTGPLTTVEVPRVEMDVRGAELLAQRLVAPDAPVQRVFLGCRLFEGSTVHDRMDRPASTRV